MTETDWLAHEHPEPMLTHIRTVASNRKLRLFAVGCCRAIWEFLPILSRTGLEVAEGFADGVVRDRARATARNASGVWAAVQIALHPNRNYPGAAMNCAWHAATHAASEAFRKSKHSSSAYDAATKAQWKLQASLLRDIFGNPFRPVAFAPVWRTSTAMSLASQMYESRDFSAMPILADALQDAGCDNEDILNHCRRHGPHVRGCWVVDLLLGKS